MWECMFFPQYTKVVWKKMHFVIKFTFVILLRAIKKFISVYVGSFEQFLKTEVKTLGRAHENTYYFSNYTNLCTERQHVM